MGQETTELRGPDLRTGVRLEELAIGELLGGHADGEPLLMYRDADGVWAVSGTCTHYSAPLIEGVADGQVIRCPWHHACFSLRSGDALAAPALNPLRRWRTEVVDGIARVTGREEENPALAGAQRVSSESVVILGAGAAGSAAAETLRREGYTGKVILIDPDANAPYDRPNLSKDYLAGTAPAEWLALRTKEFYERAGIERRVDAAVSLDIDQREVLLSNGECVPFHSLLLATGAVPLEPRVRGVQAEHVHVLRSLRDCQRLIETAASARRAVVVGASFIGMEAAAALRERGLDVAVVAREHVPFERTLGEDLGLMLQSLHERHGVTFHLGRELEAIHADEIELDDGARVQADMVLLGVGVRPRTELAEPVGLGGPEGVLVDEFLETRVRGVYAAGDLAYYPEARSGRSVRVEHWVVAQRQGQTAARNIMGRNEAFTVVPFFWTQQYDIAVRYVGHARAWDAVEVDGNPEARDCAVRFMGDGHVLAVATVGRDRECLEAELRLESTSRRVAAPRVSHGEAEHVT